MSDDYGFDTPIGMWTGPSSKYKGVAKTYGITGEDVIPMWVADMDFAVAPAIREALQVDLDRGFMGYHGPAHEVSEAVANWLMRKHGWSIDPRHVTFTNGVVAGLGATIEAFSAPGDGVIVFAPVYHAFYRQIGGMQRRIIESELIVRDGRFEMDLNALEARLEGDEKLLILCSPHNPGGRQWSAEEIRDVAAFCALHDLILVSDEIHMDLCFPGHPHIPTAIAAPEALPRLVVITAASKGFNTAGGETGIAIVPDAELRRTWQAAASGYAGQPSRAGLVMIRAAFEGAEDWSDAVRTYLARNFALWHERIGAIPGVTVMDMTSTYLSWVDFTGTGMDDDELARRVVETARIAPSPGPVFGKGGNQHMRFNLALPRPTLLDAIDRIEAAFADLQ